MKRLPTWKNALLALLAAGLLILAFPDFEWWWTAWFALVPLMWAVEREKNSLTVCFLLGWLFGTAFFFGTCWWLTYAPIHYAAVPWPIAYLLILIACLGAGVFPGTFAAILSILLRRVGSWAFLAAPFVWVFSEFLRYWVTGNNWNAVGYSQAFPGSRLLSLASVGGSAIISFVVVAGMPVLQLTFVAVAILGHRLGVLGGGAMHDQDSLFSPVPPSQSIYTILVFTAFLTSAFVLGFFLFSPATERPRPRVSNVLAIQPNVPMSGLDSRRLEHLRQRQIDLAESEINRLRTTNNELPTTVILPESPMNFMYHDDREFQQFIGDFARRNNVSVLFNSAEPDASNGKYFNSAVMVGPDGKEAAQYDKIYLLPFGEAVPRPLDGIMPGFVGNFSYGREYDLLPVGDAKAGVMICFESHFGQLSREYVRNGADVIIEMTNDGYLGPTPVLRQHLANAVFRAVETNRPVLRVTNVGITAYITENGAVLDPLPVYQEGSRTWTVSKSDGSQTFYVRFGDWFAWLCTVVTMGLLAYSVYARRRPRPLVDLPIDPKSFWDTKHTYNPRLTDNMIVAAESELGVKLPVELLELLRTHNGGYTTGYVFPTQQKNSWASDHVPFHELSGINLDRDKYMFNFLISAAIAAEDWMIPENILLLSGDGHFNIVLDYRKSREPTVAWIDFECEEDFQLAGSFREFLDGLIPQADFVSAEVYI